MWLSKQEYNPTFVTFQKQQFTIFKFHGLTKTKFYLDTELTYEHFINRRLTQLHAPHPYDQEEHTTAHSYSTNHSLDWHIRCGLHLFDL